MEFKTKSKKKKPCKLKTENKDLWATKTISGKLLTA